MTIKIKELPLSERPYEKLEIYGEKTLSNAELLAILIKSGTQNETSVELAKRILSLNKNIDKENLNFLRDISMEEFMNIKGIGRVKAIQLKALCEFAQRMNKPTNYRKVKIVKPSDIVEVIQKDMQYLKNEVLKVVILNSSNEILKIQDVVTGGANFVTTNIKNIIAETIKMQAPKMILVHNHPSGNPWPSSQDINFTNEIEKATELMGIKLLDHIIIGENCYTSIFNYRIQKENKKD